MSTNDILDLLLQRAHAEQCAFARDEDEGYDMALRRGRLGGEWQPSLPTLGRSHYVSAFLSIDPAWVQKIGAMLAANKRAISIGRHVRAFLRSPGAYGSNAPQHVRHLARVVGEVVQGHPYASHEQLDQRALFLIYALPADLLDCRLALAFLQQRKESPKANETDPATTANTILFSARAVFRDFRGVRFPVGRDGFLRQAPLEVKHRPPIAVTAEMMAQIYEATAAIEHNDPICHGIVMLALYAGLRKSEIINCRWEWVGDAQSTGTIHLRSGLGFETKKKHERIVSIEWWMLNYLRASFGHYHHGYVLGEDPRQRDAAYRRAIELLRTNGLGAARQPLHFMRKLSLTHTTHARGLRAAQQKGGHQKANMTFDRYYLRGYTAEHARLFARGPGDIAMRMRKVTR